MKTRFYLIEFICLVSAVVWAADKPNIVMILADDMGYADLGVTGCTDIPTPNIDRLANEGVFLTQSYASGSFCTPTRCSLISGMYQQRTGNDDLEKVTGPLPKSVNTLADRLREAGYTTCAIGKWHIGKEVGFRPHERGFDEFFGFLGSGHIYFPAKIDPATAKPGYRSAMYRNDTPVKEMRYLTDAFGEEAAAFVKRQAGSDKPLFLYLAFNAVHTPMHAKPADLKRFASIKDKTRRTYAGMLTAMDSAIGLTMNALNEAGLSDNTLVIFHNDNGGPTTRNAINGSINTPYRGSKCETFEGGIRVPTFLRWPGKIEPGTQFHEPNMTFDLTATMLSLGGADMEQLDGVDLMPFIVGKKNGAPHENLFWRSRPRNNNYAVLSGNWKYVHSTEGAESPTSEQHTPAREMLFNIADDPSEKTDLSKQYPEKLAEFKKRYAEWDAEMDASCKAIGLKIPRINTNP